MKRRTLLAGASSIAMAASGCLEAVAGTGGDDSSPNESDDGSSPDDSNDERPHHLYVENLTDETRRVFLRVIRRSDDEVVIDGRFELEDERGGEFREVAAWGETFDVTAAVDSGVAETFTWEIETCAGSEAENGSRNGSVRIESDAETVSFPTDSCDEIQAGAAVPTGPAEQFAIEGCESGSTDDDDQRHHLYVENVTDESRRLSLRARRCDETIVDGTYDVPDERGIEFEDVAGWDDWIVLEASLESGPTEAFSWVLEDCSGLGGKGGSRNASVRILPADAESEFEFVVDNCDEITAGAEVPVGPADYFEVDETEAESEEDE